MSWLQLRERWKDLDEEQRHKKNFRTTTHLYKTIRNLKDVNQDGVEN